MKKYLLATLIAIGIGTMLHANTDITTPGGGKKTCNAEDVAEYLNWGILYSMGLGVKKDEFKAVKLYTKACDCGNNDGCASLGAMYAGGIGVKKDEFKAVELLTKGCNGGNARGCYNLGVMYDNGMGVRQNKSKAKELFGKACDSKFTEGCKSYVELNSQGY